MLALYVNGKMQAQLTDWEVVSTIPPPAPPPPLPLSLKLDSAKHFLPDNFQSVTFLTITKKFLTIIKTF